MGEAILQTNKGLSEAIIAWVQFLLWHRMKAKTAPKLRLDW